MFQEQREGRQSLCCFIALSIIFVPVSSPEKLHKRPDRDIDRLETRSLSLLRQETEREEKARERKRERESDNKASAEGAAPKLKKAPSVTDFVATTTEE